MSVIDRSVCESIRAPVIDTHVHFDDDRFDADRDQVYERAQLSGVSAMVVPATVESRFSKIQSLANEYANVYATAGLHPMFCEQHRPNHLETLSTALPHCVAIGECGLDRQDKHADLTQQRCYFKAQIELARKNAMPLIIHARNATEDVLLMLKQAKLNRSSGNGVIHSFNGSLQQAQQLINLNYKVSFGGPITYARANKLHQLVNTLPLEAMMFETDAPDQPVYSQHGQRNEPGFINEVIKTAAMLRNTSTSQITAASNHNAITLFGLPAPA